MESDGGQAWTRAVGAIVEAGEDGSAAVVVGLDVVPGIRSRHRRAELGSCGLLADVAPRKAPQPARRDVEAVTRRPRQRAITGSDRVRATSLTHMQITEARHTSTRQLAQRAVARERATRASSEEHTSQLQPPEPL